MTVRIYTDHWGVFLSYRPPAGFPACHPQSLYPFSTLLVLDVIFPCFPHVIEKGKKQRSAGKKQGKLMGVCTALQKLVLRVAGASVLEGLPSGARLHGGGDCGLARRGAGQGKAPQQ